MKKTIILSLLMASLASVYGASSAQSGLNQNGVVSLKNAKSNLAQPIILGYYSNWDVYNKALSPSADKDYSFNSTQNLYKLARMNSVAYAFFEAAPDGTIQFTDPWSDLDESNTSFCTANPKICFVNGVVGDLRGGFGNFNKFANSGVTSGITNRLVAFGGAGHDDQVEAAMNNPTNFVNSLKTVKAAFTITGLDFDYEPVQGVSPENIPKLINLMKQVRSSLGNDFMITYTIIPNQNNINAFGATNWQEVVTTVNYINVMGYDTFGPWESITGLHSPLYVVPNTGGSGMFSDDVAITALNENGVPSGKIVLGYPSYGRAVSGVANPGLGQSFTGSYRGNLDPQNCNPTSKSGENSCSGMIAYSAISKSNYAVQEQIQNGVINAAYSNFIADGTHGVGTAYITFDSVPSVSSKVNYSKNKGLAGVMTWGINYDAPAVNGDTSPNAASLLNAVNKAYGITPRDVTPPPSLPYFILQVSNLAPDVANANAFASATLIVKGGYHVFGNQWNHPITPQLNQSWGTLPSSETVPGVIDSPVLDGIFADGATSFTTSQILINGYPKFDTPIGQPNQPQTVCTLGNGYTFHAGHSYNVMVNAVAKSCDIKMMN